MHALRKAASACKREPDRSGTYCRGSDRDAPHQIYAAGSGIPFYGGRATRFRYIVTSRFAGGEATEGIWDTDRLSPGDYILRGWAADVSGNVAERDLPVTIGPLRTEW